MFGFQRKESDRDRVKREFDHVTSTMRRAPEVAQIAFGHSINILFQIFLARFESSLAFQAKPDSEHIEYVKSLTKMEEHCQKTDPPTSLACGVFKLWIGTLMAGDPAMATYFFEQLQYFGHKGPY